MIPDTRHPDNNSLEGEALKILEALSEDELRDEVVKPYFEREGWEKVEVVDSRGELKHDCDLILSREQPGQEDFRGVQLKARESISTPGYVQRTIRPCALTALSYPPTQDGRWRLSRYYWITTGTIKDGGRAGIRDHLAGDPATAGRVEVWGGKELVDHLVKSAALRTIVPLRLVYAQSRIQHHRSRGESIFAALWAYRAFRLHLLQSPSDLEKALACLDVGLECIAEAPQREIHSYYPHLFKRVFSSWQSLIRERPSLVSPEGEGLELILGQPAVAEFFAASSFGGDTVMMLQDFELSFRQLVQLEEFYVNGPTGLSTLIICRLLLRFGFSPAEPRIEARFDRMIKELYKAWEVEGASIDDQCSLCTGVLLSCFSLARRKDEVEKVKNWLLGLKEYRFSHMRRTDGRSPGENALHYASQALLGLLDFVPNSDELLAPILDEFFEPGNIIPEKELWRGFYLKWIRYSNIDRFENYRFILSTFLRFFLSGRTLLPERTERLKHAVRALVADLSREIPEGEKVYLFYPARTNLPSLVLGLWLNATELDNLALAVVQMHHRRASTVGQRKDDQLWDSNVDRTVNFIEGLLDYWETMIALEERDGKEAVKRFLPSRAAG